MADAKMIPLAAKPDDDAPVFRRRAGAGLGGAAVSGHLAVVGLGPGDAHYLTPEADAALAAAQALYGYGPYLDRVPVRAGQIRHASDNREERARAFAALRDAAARRARRRCLRRRPWCFRHGRLRFARRLKPGRKHGVRSMSRSCRGSPRCSRSRRGLAPRWVTISVRCRLSDNLKPWELVERRLDAAAGAGFVIALYNPVSRARPWQFGAAIERLRRHLPAATPVVFGRAVGRPDERG